MMRTMTRTLLSTLLLLCTIGGIAQPSGSSTDSQQQRPRWPRFDPRHPDIHDPVMAQGEDGRYYLFATGMGVSVLSSADRKEWHFEAPVLNPIPTWATDTVRGYRGHTWAPDICYADGLWHLYYSCSTFGKNGSAIGHATNKTLDPKSPHFRWEDQGMVIASHRGKENWNAIDPNLIIDKKGNPYLSFGSFWDGIQLIRLSKEDYQTPMSEPITIARRYGKRYVNGKNINFTIEGRDTIEAGENAIEAPFIYKHGKYYYLFVSHDYCCRGDNSTYKTVYGRATSIEGPYYDRDGRRMDEGGGSPLFGPNIIYYGVGHCAVYNIDGQTIFIAHAYEKARGGRAKLFVRPLYFNSQGWIVPETK